MYFGEQFFVVRGVKYISYYNFPISGFYEYVR